MRRTSDSQRAAPELAAVEVHGITREAFLLRGALAAGAAYGIGAVGPFVGDALAQTGAGDADIVRFALTLELLEAGYYERAVRRVPDLSSENRSLAREIRDNEIEHVDTLTQLVNQLGGNPIRSLELDFGNAFASEDAFLRLAQSLEDTGVGAYNGQGPAMSSKDVLETAGEIVQVEARHAAVIRFTRTGEISTVAFDEALDQAEVLRAVNPYIEGR